MFFSTSRSFFFFLFLFLSFLPLHAFFPFLSPFPYSSFVNTCDKGNEQFHIREIDIQSLRNLHRELEERERKRGRGREGVEEREREGRKGEREEERRRMEREGERGIYPLTSPRPQ
jgi:hypothetical protein